MCLWLAAGAKRSVHVAAILLFLFWAVGVVSAFFPMQQRADIAAGGHSLTEPM